MSIRWRLILDAERTLRALQTQSELDLLEVASMFTGAVQRQSQAMSDLRDIEVANELARAEMRRLAEASVINPAAYEAVRGCLRAGGHSAAHAQQVLALAADGLDEARSELGHCRQRAFGLSRAIDTERRRKELTVATKDDLIVEDLWLHSNGSKT